VCACLVGDYCRPGKESSPRVSVDVLGHNLGVITTQECQEALTPVAAAVEPGRVCTNRD
jgi:hypothetical protein